jgi:hypothetical protein
VSVGFFVMTTLFLTPRSAKASPLTSGPPGVMLMNEQTNSNIEDLNNKKLALLKSAEENLITLTERLEKMKELSLTFHEYRQTFYRLLDSTSEELFKSIFPGEDIRNLSQLQQKLMKPEFQTLKNEISEEKSEKIEVLEFLSRKTIYFGRLNARMQQTDHKLFQLQQKFVKIESVFKRAILEHDFLNTVPLEKCEQLKRELKEHERVLFGENGLHKDFFLLKKKNFSGEYIHERYNSRTFLFLGFNLNSLKDPTKVKKLFEFFPEPLKKEREDADTDSMILQEVEQDTDVPLSPGSVLYAFRENETYEQEDTSDDESYRISENIFFPREENLSSSENSSNSGAGDDLYPTHTEDDCLQGFFCPLWWE